MFFSHKTQCLRPTTPTYFVSNMGMKDHSVTKEAFPVNKKECALRILPKIFAYGDEVSYTTKKISHP